MPEYVKGNQFWLQRSSHGRKPTFATPKDLWEAALEYFKWTEENPLWASKVLSDGKLAEYPKMRAMTTDGLCIFLDITDQTLYNYRDKNADFLDIVTKIQKVIRTQKFTGASADLLNANIIARDLGLADKKEVSGSLSLSDMTERELDAKLTELKNAES